MTALKIMDHLLRTLNQYVVIGKNIPPIHHPDTNCSNQSEDSEAESESQSPEARSKIKFNIKSQGYKRDSPEYSEAESSTSQAKQQNKPRLYKKDSFVPTIASNADLRDTQERLLNALKQVPTVTAPTAAHKSLKA